MISPFLKANGITMSKGLNPAPFMLLAGMEPSVTWGRKSGQGGEVPLPYMELVSKGYTQYCASDFSWGEESGGRAKSKRS